MQKKILLFSFLQIHLLFSPLTYADSVCEKFNGSMNCQKGVIDDVSFKGFVNVQGTTITKWLKVIGNLDVIDANVNHLYVRGNSFFRNSTFNIITSTGSMNLSDSTLTGPANLIGTIFGRNISFNSSVKIIGDVECENCQVHGPSFFAGEEKFSHSNFYQSVEFNATHVKLNETKAQDILFNNPNDQKELTLELKHSTVNNVQFLNNQGKIVLDRDSQILGKVTGGKIIKN